MAHNAAIMQHLVNFVEAFGAIHEYSRLLSRQCSGYPFVVGVNVGGDCHINIG